MSDLRELYQEVILAHARSPRNLRELEAPDSKAEGFNPMCGDRLRVQLRLSQDRIEDACFQGSGCAICMASASLMTEAVKGRTREEAEALIHRFHDLVTGKIDSASPPEDLGKLAVFAGVAEYPVRIKCAILAWHALRAALEGDDTAVTTESPS